MQRDERSSGLALYTHCRFLLALTQSKPRQVGLLRNDYPIPIGETVRLIFHFRPFPFPRFALLSVRYAS